MKGFEVKRSILHKSLSHIFFDFAPQMMLPAHLGSSFWVHIASAALFIIGFCLAFRKAAWRLRGLVRIVAYGPVFFAVPLAVFGLQHFVLFNTVKLAVPDWMPGRFFWVLIVGAALIATCLSFLADIKAGLAALLVGIMLFLFVLLIYVPNLLENPHDRFALTMPLRDLALCGGALAYAGALEAVGRHRPVRRLVEILGEPFFPTSISFMLSTYSI
jgi:uncharacterized membrane protein